MGTDCEQSGGGLITDVVVRAFIAIEIPENVRAALRGLLERLRGTPGRIGWVKPENIHLTLRFLGDVETDRVDRLAAILADACKDVAPFSVAVRGAGAFPNLRRPGVLWVGCSPADGALEAVQLAAEDAARAVGLPPDDKAFHPHLTIARIKDSRTAAAVIEGFERERAFDAGEFQVHGVSLFSSQLTPHGPLYARERELPF